ncbi:MurR/RpiR family transcriptional regulator [Streptococcus sp. S784/96/1]|uniref:MurR/RpiR family transcriptional regulator n=1 Tax=Streptococcus sp. S784/96/1 TaxID=2653499 RepID=UPI0013871008|nr:MurR/RpiR family transcriptional regulator [Streptococcus sp. S784/96/1]
MAFLEHIYSNKLSDVEREIYNFLLDNIEKVPYMRVRDIAVGAHVSPTSVFRFIQNANFDSFTEFKFYVKNYLKQKRQEASSRRLGIEEHILSLSKNKFSPDIDEDIENLADKISQARLTIFVGLGSSGSLADYISRRLSNLGYRCISFQDTYSMLSLIRGDENTVIVLLSISGETRELLELLENITMIPNLYKACITQNRGSSVASKSDAIISYSTDEERRRVYFDLSSQLPVMLILETLFDYLYK